jgi:hypothetical protein
VEKFNDNLELLLKTLAKEHRPCYLLGDYNVNLLKQDKHLPTRRFLDTILSYGFYPLNSKPTRITTQSITLFDNILTNVHDLRSKSGLWIVDISDHLPVFTIIPSETTNKPIKKIVNIRISTEDSHNKFKLKLQNFDWSILNHSTDINLMYTRFC